jgi:hypothetical protein
MSAGIFRGARLLSWCEVRTFARGIRATLKATLKGKARCWRGGKRARTHRQILNRFVVAVRAIAVVTRSECVNVYLFGRMAVKATMCAPRTDEMEGSEQRDNALGELTFKIDE